MDKESVEQIAEKAPKTYERKGDDLFYIRQAIAEGKVLESEEKEKLRPYFQSKVPVAPY